MGIVVHEHNVRCFNGRIGAHGTHGNADVRSCQHRGVVDAVSHKDQGGLGGLPGKEGFHLLHLIPRQQLAVNLRHSQAIAHIPGNGVGIACEHHRLLHACGLQIGNGSFGGGLGLVGNQEAPGVGTVHRHMHRRSRLGQLRTA